MAIMLAFAGPVKLTPDGRARQPPGLRLRGRAEDWLVGFLFRYGWALPAGTWGTVASHPVGATVLFWKRPRLAAFIVCGIFHLANGLFFDTGVFPRPAMAAATVCFEPDWPRWVARLVRSREPLSDPADPVGKAATAPDPAGTRKISMRKVFWWEYSGAGRVVPVLPARQRTTQRITR